MNELLKTIGISLVISVIVVLAFSGSARQTFGTIGAGITNLSGLSITGIPGTFDVSSKATMNGSVVLTPTNGCIQLNGTGLSGNYTLTIVASTTAPTNGSGVIAIVTSGVCP